MATVSEQYSGSRVITTHNSETCDAAAGQPCKMCRWASEVERRQVTTTRRDHLLELRRNLIDEIERLHAELGRVHDEMEQLENADE